MRNPQHGKDVSGGKRQKVKGGCCILPERAKCVCVFEWRMKQRSLTFSGSEPVFFSGVSVSFFSSPLASPSPLDEGGMALFLAPSSESRSNVSPAKSFFTNLVYGRSVVNSSF